MSNITPTTPLINLNTNTHPTPLNGTHETHPLGQTATPSIPPGGGYPSHTVPSPSIPTASSSIPTSIPNPTFPNPNPNPTLPKKRKYTHLLSPEYALHSNTTDKLHLSLLNDQLSTLYPNKESLSKFESREDLVERLIPWHIWQIPAEELLGGKGKGREERDTREAEMLCKRIKGVTERFEKARRREGRHPSDLPSLITMINSSTSSMRDELSLLQTKLRSARTEHESIQAEQRRLTIARMPGLTLTPAVPVSSFSVSSGTATAVRAALAAASTPARTSPMATKTSSTTPVTPGSDRGRPRGRPRGRGRGGLRGSDLGHLANGTPSPHPTSPIANNTTPKVPAPTTPIAKINGAASGSGSTQPPIQITVQINHLPQFVALGLLVLNPNPATPNAPKPPAHVLKTTEDKKSVLLSVNLGACTQRQLTSLAKLLNVPTTPTPAPIPTISAAGKGGSTPGTPVAGTPGKGR